MSKHFKPFLGILALVFLLSLTTSENTSANSSKLNVKINPVLQISVNYEPITIEADGNLNISDVALRVSSNNRTGFKTYMSTTHETSEENATSLAYEDIDTVETLSEDNLAAENFTMNKWGYSIDGGTTFSSVHAKDFAPSEVLATEKASDNGNINIQIGIKVNDEKASGKYTNTLLFTTIPNYTPITLEDITYMQEVTPEICEVTPNEEQYQLNDIRDGKPYWVARLADGNCWMTQNLDYDLNSSVALTPEDSDVTENWTPSRATIAGAANLNSTNWANNLNNPYSFDPGNYYFDGTYYDSSECNYLTTTCDHFATTPYDLNGEHGHVGNYYNWSAAVASNDTSATTAAGTDINTSICPKGWRLPHGYQSTQGDDFATLNTAYGGATNSDSVLLANPLFFARGGHVNSGYLVNPAYYGLYWSSTAYSAAYADDFSFRSGYVYASDYLYRINGFSVRCLARKQTKTLTVKDQADDSVIVTYDFETSYKLPEVQKEGYNLLGYAEDKTATEPTYNVGDTITEPKTLYAIYKRPLFNMQDVATWKNYLNLEEQVQVKDTRDGKIYWVAKLKDGNIWMTQNLDLDLSTTTTLTPADSDVTANWTSSRATIAGAANLNTTNWANNSNSPYSFDPGNYYFDGTYYSSSASCNYLTTTCDHFATTPYDLNGEHGHIGNYYNWSAAVASNDTSTTTAAGTDINTSICPKGWRLPHGYQSTQGNDFATLNTAYGGATNSDSVLLANPLFFVRGGYVYSGLLRGSAHIGYYWSSTAYSATYADNLVFSPNVTPSAYNGRYYGISVRCLAR